LKAVEGRSQFDLRPPLTERVVEQADPDGFAARKDALGLQDPPGLPPTEESFQSTRSAPARWQTWRKSDRGIGPRHGEPDVAGEGEFQPGAETRAVDECDGGDRGRGKFRQHLLPGS
jgi:hypothetical protein